MSENDKASLGAHAQQILMSNFLNSCLPNEMPIVANGGVKHENDRNKAAPSATATLGSDGISDHYEPSVRLLRIRKTITGSCGFHLTRTKWDPYPWVSAVDAHTAAEMSGLVAGDCVLEVNGEDVLGLRITDIAKLVQAKSGHVTLLLWNCGSDFKCDPESLCCAPMPRTLQRLATIVQSVLTIIECPVCMDTIAPPALQCQNGHLLCLNCRIRAEKCPVCRDRYTPLRALIAEQIYAAITSAYNLCSTNEDKLRQKLFGGPAQTEGNVMSRRWRRAEATKQKTIDDDQQTEVGMEGVQVRKGLSERLRRKVKQCQSQHVAPGDGRPGRFSLRKETDVRSPQIGITDASTDASAVKRDNRNKKMHIKLWHTKAASMENLSTSFRAKRQTTSSGELNCRVITTNSSDNGLALDGATTQPGICHTNALQLSTNRTVSNASDELKLVLKNSQDPSAWGDNKGEGRHHNEDANTTTTTTMAETPPTSIQPTTMPLNYATTKETLLNTAAINDVAHVNAMSKLLSATTTPTANDLSAMPECYPPLPTPFPYALQQQQVACERNNRCVEDEAETKMLQKNENAIKKEIISQQQHVQPQLQLSMGQQQQHIKEPSNNWKNNTKKPADPPPAAAIAVARCATGQQSQTTTYNDYNTSNCEKCSCPSSALLFVDKRRPAGPTLNHSLEYFNKCCWSTPTAALPPADLQKLGNCNSMQHRKNSNSSSSNSNEVVDSSSSGIVDSSHSILTPASSLSSGVFFCSLEPNDFATTIERCSSGGEQQEGSEITDISANKNTLISRVTSLGQPSSITSSLHSLSPFASTSFSSAS